VRKSAFFFLCLGVALTGCSADKKPVPSTTGSSAPVSGNPPDRPNGKPDAAAEAAAMRERLVAAQRFIQPAKAGTDGWVKSKLKPTDITQAAESKMTTLKTTTASSTTQADLEENLGMSVSRVFIKSPTVFRIEYVRPALGAVPSLFKEALVANGTSYANFAMESSGWSDQKPVKALGDEGKVTTEGWLLESTRKAFSAISGGKPFTNLLTDAKAKGMDTVLEERTVEGSGRRVKQYRLLMNRTSAAEKVDGKLTYEITFDDFFKLPVTFRNYHLPLKGKGTAVMWTIRWNFDPAQTFEADQFKIGDAGTGKGQSTTL
jgi:hypothetical protein